MSEQNVLDRSWCYLAGPIECVSDGGVAWRREFIKLAKQVNLKIEFLDPTNKPGKTLHQINEDRNYQKSLKIAGKWKELCDFVSEYRRLDLRIVDQSDFLVAMIDPTIPQWGTSNEIYEAERQHKPIFFVCKGGLVNLPNWLFGLVNLPDESKGIRSNVFDNIEDVISELIKINNGEIPIDDEWVLLRRYV